MIITWKENISKEKVEYYSKKKKKYFIAVLLLKI